MAHQLDAKATRDGFFLEQFSAADLPKAAATASLASIALALWSPHMRRRWGPARLIPAAFALSGLLHAAEWFAGPQWPRLTVSLVYLHVFGFGAILLSGFWLLLSERFNPQKAKRIFGRVAVAGTASGGLGGVATERMVHWFDPSALLLLLASLHVDCAVCTGAMGGSAARAANEAPGQISPLDAFRRTPLRSSSAAAPLFFALYYTACQVLTLLLQVGLAGAVLRRWGVATTASSLPIMAAVGSATAIVFPSLSVLTGGPAMEAIVLLSFFRSAYELFHIPVGEADKRAAKTTIDVACDRLGDGAGAFAIQSILFLQTTPSRLLILSAAFALSAVSAAIALRTGALYRDVLEQGLLRHAKDDPMMTAAMGKYLGRVVDSLPADIRQAQQSATVHGHPLGRAEIADPLVRTLAELPSGFATRVLAALGPERPWDRVLAAQSVQLLAWDEVSSAARAYLERGAPRIAGQLTDALLDPACDFAIRRHVPRILAQTGLQSAVDGLILALAEERFEVRFQCGRALDYLRQHHPHLTISEGLIFSAIERELSVDKELWNSWRILERRPSDDSDIFLDHELRDRADQRLEHIFSMLALVLSRSPLMAAFRGPHREDPVYRGMALEYLDNLLPARIHNKMASMIESL